MLLLLLLLKCKHCIGVGGWGWEWGGVREWGEASRWALSSYIFFPLSPRFAYFSTHPFFFTCRLRSGNEGQGSCQLIALLSFRFYAVLVPFNKKMSPHLSTPWLKNFPVYKIHYKILPLTALERLDCDTGEVHGSLWRRLVPLPILFEMKSLKTSIDQLSNWFVV